MRHTPWGQPQVQDAIAPGITWVSTASHGGYHLTPERRKAMPDEYRGIPTFAGGNWYEEDCDWALVALSFPEHFNEKTLEAARETFAWSCENSERYT